MAACLYAGKTLCCIQDIKEMSSNMCKWPQVYDFLLRLFMVEEAFIVGDNPSGRMPWSWHLTMLVTAFLCPKLQDRGKGDLEANNRFVLLAGAGGKMSTEKPQCQESGDICKGSGGRKETGRTKASGRKVGTMRAYRAGILQLGKDGNWWHAQYLGKEDWSSKSAWITW